MNPTSSVDTGAAAIPSLDRDNPPVVHRRIGIARGLAVVVAAAAIVAGLASPAQAAPTQAVAVSLREFSIAMPSTLRPGPTVFVIRNRGRFPHNFTALYGPVRFHSGTVPPGATVRLTATLVPGAYLVACTILNGGHLARGMLTLFTIGTRAHGSAHWHYP